MNKKNILENIIYKINDKPNYYKYLQQPLYINEEFNFDKRRYDYLYKLYKNLPDLNNKKVLDLGCNFGNASFIMKSLFPSIRITAIDMLNPPIEIAQMINQYFDYDIDFKVRDGLMDLQEDINTFDYIFCSFLFPNVNYMEWGIELMRKYENLKSSNILIIFPDDYYDINKTHSNLIEKYPFVKIIENEICLIKKEYLHLIKVDII